MHDGGTGGPRLRSPERPHWLAMAGVVVTIGSLWLPWHHSGDRVRNAFQLVSAADRLEIGPEGLRTAWRWGVALLPVLGAAAWIVLLQRIRWLFVTLGAAVALIAGPTAVGILAAPGGSRVGPAAALLGLAAAVSATPAVIRSGRRRPTDTP